MRAWLVVLALCIMASRPAAAAATVEISGLADMNLGSWGMGDPAISSSMDICVFAGNNTPAGGYSITATGNNNLYILANGSQQIPYTLYWDDSGAGSLGSTGGTQLTSGVALTTQIHANTNTLNPLCVATGATARLTLKITQASMTTALAGTYNGTLTLLLSPN